MAQMPLHRQPQLTQLAARLRLQTPLEIRPTGLQSRVHFRQQRRQDAQQLTHSLQPPFRPRPGPAPVVFPRMQVAPTRRLRRGLLHLPHHSLRLFQSPRHARRQTLRKHAHGLPATGAAEASHLHVLRLDAPVGAVRVELAPALRVERAGGRDHIPPGSPCNIGFGGQIGFVKELRDNRPWPGECWSCGPTPILHPRGRNARHDRVLASTGTRRGRQRCT